MKNICEIIYCGNPFTAFYMRTKLAANDSTLTLWPASSVSHIPRSSKLRFTLAMPLDKRGKLGMLQIVHAAGTCFTYQTLNFDNIKINEI